jgi:hypothetical protein
MLRHAWSHEQTYGSEGLGFGCAEEALAGQRRGWHICVLIVHCVQVCDSCQDSDRSAQARRARLSVYIHPLAVSSAAAGM